MEKLLAILVGAIIATAGLALPAHADPFEFSGDWGTLAAPTKKAKGALYGPYAICEVNRDDGPDAYQIVARQDGRVVARASDGYAELTTGTYHVTVSATCDGATKSIAKTLEITYLKDSESVSRGEYKKIKKGQSTKKIRKIIGGKLDYLYKENGRTWYSKPNTELTGRVFLQFRKGKLVHKEWASFTHP